MTLYAVKYTGPFGFIKPWTAVRDTEIMSQQFLTPSILEGIEKKLFPYLLERPTGKIYTIQRHRLSYSQISYQQERIQPRGWNKKEGYAIRPQAVLTRGIFLDPVLWLCFANKNHAETAFQQHICLCRNEDILLPTDMQKIAEKAFDTNSEMFPGFELIAGNKTNSFHIGHNRYNRNRPMNGWLHIVGNPVKSF
jgi:hypothetical protein